MNTDIKPELFSSFGEFEAFIKDHSNELWYLQVINGTADEEPMTEHRGRVVAIKQLDDDEIQMEFMDIARSFFEGETKRYYKFSDVRLTNDMIHEPKSKAVKMGFEVAAPKVAVFNSFADFAEKYKNRIFSIIQLKLDAQDADLGASGENNQYGQIKKVTVLDDGDVLIGFELFAESLENDNILEDMQEVVYHKLSDIQLSYYPEESGEEEECDV